MRKRSRKIDGEIDEPLEPRISWPIWSNDCNPWPLAGAFGCQTFECTFVKGRICPTIASSPVVLERVIIDGVKDRELSVMISSEEIDFVCAP